MLKRIRNQEEKVDFKSFLSGTPARDYTIQDTPYEEQILRSAQMIREADYVLLGAGAGMSTAAADLDVTPPHKTLLDFRCRISDGRI